MYNSYYGFVESPFADKLDQKFLFPCDDHGEVLSGLLHFLKEEKSIAVISGDVGTGKTMLVLTFLSRLPESTRPIIISNPNVTPLELLQYVAKTLGINDTSKPSGPLTEEVRQALASSRREGLVHILIVDEAHLLTEASLEYLGRLAGIGAPEERPLQILLVGQNELQLKLESPKLEELGQQIGITRSLLPLNPLQTIRYINHRLKQVGSRYDYCFEPDCRSLIFQITEGVPRRINQLCDRALMICMSEGLRKVNRRILEEARDALVTDMLLSPPPPRREATPLRRKLLKIVPLSLAGLAGLAVLAALAWGLVWSPYGLWGKKAPSPRPVPEIAGIPSAPRDVPSGPGIANLPRGAESSTSLPQFPEPLVAPGYPGPARPAAPQTNVSGQSPRSDRLIELFPGCSRVSQLEVANAPAEQPAAVTPAPQPPLKEWASPSGKIVDTDRTPVLTLGCPLPVGWNIPVNQGQDRPKAGTRTARVWKPGRAIPRKSPHH